MHTTWLKDLIAIPSPSGGEQELAAYLANWAEGRGYETHTDAGNVMVRLWDVTDASRPRLDTTYSGHVADVPSLAFSPDGTYIASGGNDTTIRLWDVGLDRAIARLCARSPRPMTPEQWDEHYPGVPYRQGCR